MEVLNFTLISLSFNSYRFVSKGILTISPDPEHEVFIQLQSWHRVWNPWMDFPEVVKPRHVEIKLKQLHKGTGVHREGTHLSRDFGMGWVGRDLERTWPWTPPGIGQPHPGTFQSQVNMKRKSMCREGGTCLVPFSTRDISGMIMKASTGWVISLLIKCFCSVISDTQALTDVQHR